MRLRSILPRAFLLVGTLGTLAGCGPHPYPVSGLVVYSDGQPATDLAGSDVIFTSEASSSSGAIDEQGHYTLTTHREGDGALPGTYKVVIVPPQPVGADDPKARQIRRAVPAKYTKPTTTDLTAAVEAKTNDITLTIPAPRRAVR